MQNKKELLKALELDRNGDWDGAHETVQVFSNLEACWIHAYLHRKEGDKGNAQYWYNRANKKMPKASLDEEREEIQDHLDGL